MVEICPSCARRDIPEDSESGFCSQCDTNRTSEAYAEKDRQASDRRRERWTERSDAQRTFERLRQQRHRTLQKVKPREPCPEMPDPLRLAEEGVLALERIRPSVKNANALELLDRTEEIVRRLGWGPDEPAKPEPQEDDEPKSWGWSEAMTWRRDGSAYQSASR